MNTQSTNQDGLPKIPMQQAGQTVGSAPLTRAQLRQAEIEAKIAKLPKDHHGRPVIRPVRVGGSKVTIMAVPFRGSWAFRVSFFKIGSGTKERVVKRFRDPDHAIRFASEVAASQSEYLAMFTRLSQEKIREFAKALALLTEAPEDQYPCNPS